MESVSSVLLKINLLSEIRAFMCKIQTFAEIPISPFMQFFFKVYFDDCALRLSFTMFIAIDGTALEYLIVKSLRSGRKKYQIVLNL